MTASVRKPAPVWKLVVAMGFLGFSLWLSVGPLLDEAFNPIPERRDAPVQESHNYGGFRSDADMLSRYASYSGEARDLPDPFTWTDTLPHPSPGGIATTELINGVSQSADVVETRISEDEEEPIPEIQIRLILRTKKSSRVLVDGQILGVGDLTRAGKIVEILDTGIQTMYRGKKLFFALSPR